MFAKPYKLKSINTLKNSEKKQLVKRIQDEFPSTDEEKVKELVPTKSSAICMKVILHNTDTVSVFAVNGVPIVIDTHAGLIPTVCALWKLPDLLPVVTIHTPVLPKIQQGAPLYLPGVVLPQCGVGFPMFKSGTLVTCNTQDNMAAAIVGQTLMSSGDMLLKAGGVCLETLNVIGDLLCKEPKFNKIERPKQGNAVYTRTISTESTKVLAEDINTLHIGPSNPSLDDEWPLLEGRLPPPAPPPSVAPLRPPVSPPPSPSPSDSADVVEVDGDVTENAETEPKIPEDMDGLLRWCLLAFIKLESKSVELPLLTNLLYKNHMIPLCPPGRSLDVKKSSYKKMGKFLEAMQQEGLLEVRELDKGVAAVVGLAAAHPAARAFAAPPAPAPAPAPPPDRARPEQEYSPPLVREMLCVTAHVLPLFPRLKKGAALAPAEVRAALTDYVRARGLVAAGRKGHVVLDGVLAAALGKQEQDAMTWEALMSSVQSRMTAATQLRFADGTSRLVKTRLDPVTAKVTTRSGNKLVTLVSNLEAYGFVLPALSTTCQRAVGAACGVTRAPGARHDQLMLQGDQTRFVTKLLIEKYGLPKKFVEGADKMLNKKK